jgi:transcription antitermination factor NusG
MRKNWYIVYTKRQCEKKVVAGLNRRKIENYCPFNQRKIRFSRRDKILSEPLFKSYVFANVASAKVYSLKQMRGVINIVYWRSEPAVVAQDEIDAIKEFINDHRNIELVRTRVNFEDVAKMNNSPFYSFEGDVIAIKNKVLEVSLPSLGYIMVAKIENENIFEGQLPYKINRLTMQGKEQQQ